MRFLVFTLCMIYFLSPTTASALSCAPPSDPEAVPQNELIVRARLLERKTEAHIPLLEESFQKDDILTFEVVSFYKAPADQSAIFKAHLSPLYKSWGPDLKPGIEGEYLFSLRKGGGWDYAGPGACTYVSEKAWQVLRENAKDHE